MNHIRTAPVVVVIIAILILSACGFPEAEPTPTPDAAEQVVLAEQRVELIDTSWEVDHFGGVEDSMPVLPDTKLTMNMMAERYAGYNGCNWFLGVYEINGAELRYLTPAVTAVICEDEEVSMQAASYMSTLVNITEYAMDGEKLDTFTVDEQEMATFIPAERVEVEGTNWTAKFVNDGEQMQPASYEYTISALFENGKLSGNGGCNDYTADYVIAGNKITITNIETPGLECAEPAGVNNFESWYLAALEEATNYTSLVTSLILKEDTGQDLVFFGTP